MINKSGFLLIETIVYLVIFSLLIFIMLQMNVSSIRQLIQSREKLSLITSMHALLQRFVRDIQRAPATENKWPVIKPDMLIWHDGDVSIGWMMDKNNLVRHQGSYNIAKNSWGKKTKSVGAKKVKSLTFSWEKIEDRLKEISMMVEVNLPDKQTKTFVTKALLQNRMLP